MLKKFLFALGVFWFNWLQAAQGNTWTLLVPFAAGSAQDVFARLISDRLGQELNGRVVVVNKPGAGGTIGAAFVAQAKPDGRTLLMGASSLHLAGGLYANLPYHPLNSFQAAGFWGMSSYVLVVSENLPVQDLASFVRHIRSHPDAFNYASSGQGSVTHLGMASFMTRAGMQMVHLPLNGTHEIIREIVSGRVHAAMLPALSIKSYSANPRLRLLAIADAKPSARWPNLPTLHNSGYPGFHWQSWVGLLAPSGTPAVKLQEIDQAVHRVIAAPDMQQRFGKLGIDPQSMPLPEFNELLGDDWSRISELVKSLAPE